MIITTLKALQKLGAETEKEYIAELLVQAASGDEEIRMHFLRLRKEKKSLLKLHRISWSCDDAEISSKHRIYVNGIHS